MSPGLYSDSEESGSGTEEGSDDEEYDDDDDGSQGSEDYTDEEEDLENESNGSYSESAASEDKYADSIDPDDHKARSYTNLQYLINFLKIKSYDYENEYFDYSRI